MVMRSRIPGTITLGKQNKTAEFTRRIRRPATVGNPRNVLKNLDIPMNSKRKILYLTLVHSHF